MHNMIDLIEGIQIVPENAEAQEKGRRGGDHQSPKKMGVKGCGLLASGCFPVIANR